MLSVLEKEEDRSFSAGRPSSSGAGPADTPASGTPGSSGQPSGTRPPMPERPVPGSPAAEPAGTPASPPAVVAKPGPPRLADKQAAAAAAA
eukprot:1668151-Alexandrium_andersonii.AAC.1